MCSALLHCIARCWRWLRCLRAGFFGAAGRCSSPTLRKWKKLQGRWRLGVQWPWSAPEGRWPWDCLCPTRPWPARRSSCCYLNHWKDVNGMKSLERFSASDLLSSHVPPSSGTVSGDTARLQTDIESLLTSCATLLSRKAFSECVWATSPVKPCYSDLKLGKLAISAVIQSHCGEGIH